MADLRIKRAVSSVAHGNSDGTMVDVRGTRDGAMFTASWLTALALEGRCFCMNTATASSPDTFTTAYAATTPDAYIYVPPGTSIIPVNIEVVFEDTDYEAAVDVIALLSSTSDSSPGNTSVTIHNMRTDDPIQSNCTAAATVDGVGSTPLAGNFLEFWRGSAGFQDDDFSRSR